jgi:hypothetical protein
MHVVVVVITRGALGPRESVALPTARCTTSRESGVLYSSGRQCVREMVWDVCREPSFPGSPSVRRLSHFVVMHLFSARRLTIDEDDGMAGVIAVQRELGTAECEAEECLFSMDEATLDAPAPHPEQEQEEAAKQMETDPALRPAPAQAPATEDAPAEEGRHPARPSAEPCVPLPPVPLPGLMQNNVVRAPKFLSRTQRAGK